MLCVARQARTAYSAGPVQNRRCVAGQELRSSYTTTQTAWLDAQANNLPLNTTVTVINDAAVTSPGSNFEWWTSTNPASTYPLYVVNANVKGVQFDGVDDLLQDRSNMVLAVQTITIVALYRNSSPAPQRIILEGGTDYNFQTGSFLVSGDATGAGSSLRGDVGYSYRTWASDQTPWTCTATVMNKAAGLGAEILAYENGTQITVFTASADSDNTNTFANQICRVGRRSNGVSPMTGVIAGITVFTRQLSLFEIQQVTQLLRWHAGLA